MLTRSIEPIFRNNKPEYEDQSDNQDQSRDEVGKNKLPAEQNPHNQTQFDDQVGAGELECPQAGLRRGSFLKSDLVVATAPNEQLDEAAPNKVPSTIGFIPWPPSAVVILSSEMKDSTAPAIVNPSTRAHHVVQTISAASINASISVSTKGITEKSR